MNNSMITTSLALEIDELESMEAPGFWHGFAAGMAFVGLVVAAIT